MEGNVSWLNIEIFVKLTTKLSMVRRKLVKKVPTVTTVTITSVETLVILVSKVKLGANVMVGNIVCLVLKVIT
jgi:hypothetical protein